jgi:hypothetical protein
MLMSTQLLLYCWVPLFLANVNDKAIGIMTNGIWSIIRSRKQAYSRWE